MSTEENILEHNEGTSLLGRRRPTQILVLFLSFCAVILVISTIIVVCVKSKNSDDLSIIKRTEWSTRIPKSITTIKNPFRNVVIIHTVTDNCWSQEACTNIVLNIQQYHMDSLDFPDIAYNFLIGGDGSIFEGVGWDLEGTHTVGYNTIGLGIALIGNFQNMLPSRSQLEAAKKLIEKSADLQKVYVDYKLYGQRQLIPTLSPGELLYQAIQKWTHFSNRVQ